MKNLSLKKKKVQIWTFLEKKSTKITKTFFKLIYRVNLNK